MPSTNAQSHNCRAGSSKRPQAISLGKKRKHQLLSDVVDGSNIEDMEDKGKKTTRKSKSNGETCTRESSRRSEPAFPARTHRQRLFSDVSDIKDTQDEKVRRKLKKLKKLKAKQKCCPSQSSREPSRGILRDVAKPESRQRPLSTCLAKSHKHRPLPDIFGDNLDKHAAQDAKVLETFKKHQFPENAMDVVPLQMYIFEITGIVVLVAQSEDPNVPLGARSADFVAAFADEDFRKVADSCYRSKSFMGVRNHPVLRKDAKLHSKYDSRVCSCPAIN